MSPPHKQTEFCAQMLIWGTRWEGHSTFLLPICAAQSRQGIQTHCVGKKSVQIAMRTFHCDSWRQQWRFGRTCHNPFLFCKEPHQLFLLKWRFFFLFNPRNSRISKGGVLPTNFTVAKISVTLLGSYGSSSCSRLLSTPRGRYGG